MRIHRRAIHGLPFRQQLIGEGILPISPCWEKWEKQVKEIFEQANLSIPEGTGGVNLDASRWKRGRHTEQLVNTGGMQFLQRATRDVNVGPGAANEWRPLNVETIKHDRSSRYIDREGSGYSTGGDRPEVPVLS